MRIISLFSIFISIILFNNINSQISLTATAGTSLSASYTTLSAAFTAINTNTTHLGTITITITGTCTEPTSLVPLTSNAYGSLTIRPNGNAIINSAPANFPNRSVITLSSVKNVTIDGDDPLTPGTNNLTINMANASNQATIRILSASTANFSENIIIKNCNIKGSNAGATSTNFSACLLIGGTAFTQPMTSACSSAKTITIENNKIYNALYGIFVAGSFGNECSNITISKNTIGSDIATEYITGEGIHAEFFSTNTDPSTISENDIKVGVDAATGISTSTYGIFLGSGSEDVSIFKNNIHDIKNNTTSTTNFVAGVRMTGSFGLSNIKFFNNIVRDVTRRKISTALIDNGGTFGLLVDGGNIFASHTGFEMYNNTIALNQPNTLGTVNDHTNICFVFVDGNGTVSRFFNNIILNNNTGANTMGHAFTGGVLAGSLSFDYNAYHVPSGSLSFNTPNLNQWQATGFDLNSIETEPPFVSATDFHIADGTVTKLESGGTSWVGSPTSADDIDGDFRPGPSAIFGGGTSYDIGADEFDGAKYVASSYTTFTSSPNLTPCISNSRLITANIVKGNAFDTVQLQYQFDNDPIVTVDMTPVGTSWEATIPIAPTNETLVSYRIRIIDNTKDTIRSYFKYYKDNVVTQALLPSPKLSVDSVCIGTVVNVDYEFDPNPTVFIVPPIYTSTVEDLEIVSVNAGNISNSSTVNSLTGTLGQGVGTASKYSDFSALAVDTFELGKVYNFSITLSNPVATKSYLAIFIDLNGNGFFDDIGERVYTTTQSPIVGNGFELGQFFLNSNARPGNTRMRIISADRQVLQPNSIYSRGETEDYAIYIKPFTFEIKANGTVVNKGTNYTVSTIPTYISLTTTDYNGCVKTDTISTLAQSSPNMTADILSTNQPCYSDPYILEANVIGGCPPYTYSWSNGATTRSIIPSMTTDSSFSVTITDNGSNTASLTKSFVLRNPKPLTIDSADKICERGFTTLKATRLSSDSIYWYDSNTGGKFNYISVDNEYNTSYLQNTKIFYVSTSSQTSENVGLPNTGAPGINNSFVSILTGLVFDTKEAVEISSCELYGVGTNAKLVIAIMDLAGNDIAVTPEITFNSGNITTPVTIPLNLKVNIPGNNYVMYLKSATGLSQLNRTTLTNYPYTSPSGSMAITSGYNIGNKIANNYFYFYNIKLVKGICIGEKVPVRAEVILAKTPKITQDLQRSFFCKKDTMYLKVQTDSTESEYVWYRNGVVIKNQKDDTLKVYNANLRDTGLYKVKLSSDSFCYRDTTSKEVLISYHPEARIDSVTKDVYRCVGSDDFLKVYGSNVDSFRFTFNNIVIQDDTIPRYDLNSLTKSDTGYYRVDVQDKNKCRIDSIIKAFRVNVFDHPTITLNPTDTTICVDETFVLKSKADNYTNLKWIKNGEELQFYNRDSIKINFVELSDSGIYQLRASSYPGCADTYTTTAKVTINPAPQILSKIQNIKLCDQDKLSIKSLSNYRDSIVWQFNGTLIGVTSDSLIISNVSTTDAGKYNFVAKGLTGCKDEVSPDINLTVAPYATYIGGANTVNICSGDQLNVPFIFVNANIFEWYKGNDAIQGQSTSTLNFSSISKNDEGKYYVKYRSDEVCPFNISDSFDLIVTQRPEIYVQPVGDTLCLGSNARLEVFSSSSNGYRWRFNGVLLPSTNSPVLNINNISQAQVGSYTVEVLGQTPCPAFISSVPVNLEVISKEANAYLTNTSVFRAVENCVDGEGWTLFSPLEDMTKVVFAVKKNANVFTSSADILVNSGVNSFIKSDKNGYYGSLIGQRNWNLNVINGDVNSNMDVRFYYRGEDITSIDEKFVEILDIYDDVSFTPESISWFKTTDTLFSNKLLQNVVGDSLKFNYEILENNVEGIENNINYIVFQDVTSQGGGGQLITYRGASKVYTSIDDADASTTHMYPNPATDYVDIYINNDDRDEYDIKIYNNLGQVAFQKKFEHNKSTKYRVDLVDLASGNYYISINGKKYIYYNKLSVIK